MSTPISQTPNRADLNQVNETIVQRINQVRRQVKRVELITTIAALATFLLAFLLCSVVLDHWVFKEGTPLFLRWVMIVGFLLLGIVFFIWKLIPILRFPVNPAYAAEVLERCHPDMKNSLLNWVFLKREKRSQSISTIQRHILEGISRTTAGNLTQVQTELVVDHHQAFRWGIGCIILLGLFFLYTVFSPKSPLDSIIRTINPLTSLDAPQSLIVKDVTPGDLTVFQGTFTQITARLDRPTKLPVHVVYSTHDGKLSDQRVPMTPKEDGYHFETRFPPGKTGFQESLTYRIEAGESRSQSWNLTVRPAIYLQAEKLEYRYPEYTGLAPETVENGGDINALEGTTVTLYAGSNIEMARAEILFDAKSERTVSMAIATSDPTKASTAFTLRFDDENPEKQIFSTYLLKCRDKESNSNPAPVLYSVKVIRDLAPIVNWVDENDLPTEVPVNSRLNFQVEAEDPDFGLRQVRLIINKVETGKENADLLMTPFPPVELLEMPTPGKLTLKGSIILERLRLKPGDRVDYYVEAVDLKLPQPNPTQSSIKSFIVTDPVDNPEQEPNKDDSNDSQEDQPQDSQSSENPNQEGSNQPEGSQNTENQDKNQQDNNEGKQDPDNPDQDQNGQQNGESDQQQQNDKQQGNQQQSDDNRQDQGNDQGNGQESDQGEQQNQKNGGQDQQEGDSGAQNQSGSGGNQPENESGSQDQNQSNSGQNSGEPSDENGNDSGDSDSATSDAGKPTNQQQSHRPEPRKRDKPVDGESNPGDVFRETLERMKEQGFDPEKMSKSNQNRENSENSGQFEEDPKMAEREKTEKGTPPKQRPQQGKDTQDRNSPDAFSAKEGDNSQAQKFDPTHHDKPIYQDPNDPGKESSGNGKPEHSADELKLDPKPQGDSPRENPSKENPSSQENDPNQNGDQKGEGAAESSNDSQGRQNRDTNRSDSNRPASDNPSQPGGGDRNQTPHHDQEGNVASVMDPNLEYTEKATSLALDYLENELGKQEPDSQLLDRLRWNKQDLEKFVARWKQMQENANRAQRDSQDSKQWEETLKNIGRLTPRTTTGIRDEASRTQSTATEAHRYTPPAKLRARAEAYTQGLGSQKQSHDGKN